MSSTSGLCERRAEPMRADSRPVTSPSGCLVRQNPLDNGGSLETKTRGLSARTLVPGMFHPVMLTAAAQLRNGGGNLQSSSWAFIRFRWINSEVTVEISFSAVRDTAVSTPERGNVVGKVWNAEKPIRLAIKNQRQSQTLQFSSVELMMYKHRMGSEELKVWRQNIMNTSHCDVLACWVCLPANIQDFASLLSTFFAVQRQPNQSPVFVMFRHTYIMVLWCKIPLIHVFWQ